MIHTRRDFLVSSAAMAMPARAATGSVPLGKLDPFWRYSAALGPYLETGNGLMQVPDYMLAGDFPYRKRPFPQEVLFADHLSLVRLLGGYLKKGVAEDVLREQDLAWRDASGKIRYRMNLLRPRLQPYLTQGYREFTLVLDNVPYCFPAEPAAKGLGQYRPPRDPAEWKDFIREFAREIVNIFGADDAARLRFRVGTENNGRERFDGTFQRFVRHYEDSAAAVLEIIPGARISFYNISGVSVKGIPSQNINSFALAEHCAAGRRHTPVDFIAFSRYYAPHEDPETHGRTCRAVWEEFGKRVSDLKKTPREVQEFGTATWIMKKAGEIERSEPGPMGAAQLAQMMFRLREAGVQRLWHWGLLDTAIRDNKGVQRFFPTGQTWVYSILEYMAGGEAFLFPIANSNDGIKRLAAGSMKQDSAILMISAYHPDGAARPVETIEFSLPGEMLPKTGRVPRIVRLNASNCVHSLVREDMAAAGLLGADYVRNPRFLGNVREMAATRAGEALAAGNEARYIDAWTKSLTLRPLTSDDGALNGQTVRLRISPPEAIAVVL